MSSSFREITLTVDVGHGNAQRLDLYLKEQLSEYSRTALQSFIEEHHVVVNGEHAKKNRLLYGGEKITLSFPQESEQRDHLLAQPIPLAVLYEDDDVIIINKEAGMVVHPAPGHSCNTVVNALLSHCQTLPCHITHPLRPGIVHRLDKETSGALIAAKTRRAHDALSQLFAERKMEKTYLALIWGKLKQESIATPIERDPKSRKKMRIARENEGKEALTTFKLLEQKENIGLIQAFPHTGRTHQIRVHLASLHTPILGDPLYGYPAINARYALLRQMLHAYRIRFVHPITGKAISVTAPLPQDMLDCLKETGIQQ